jgi:hypothetical protein
MGLCTAEMRLPMCEIQPTSKEKVRAAMVKAGLIKAAAVKIGDRRAAE